jgi:hypothetical protein
VANGGGWDLALNGLAIGGHFFIVDQIQVRAWSPFFTVSTARLAGTRGRAIRRRADHRNAACGADPSRCPVRASHPNVPSGTALPPDLRRACDDERRVYVHRRSQ